MTRKMKIVPLVFLVAILSAAFSLITLNVFSAELSITKSLLDNGMTLIVKENKANDIVGAQFLIKVGTIVEPKEKSGIGNFVSNLLLKGTLSRSAEEIAFETEASGIDIDTGVSSDYSQLTVISTTEFFPKAIEIAADLLMNASFPAEEIEKERRAILQQIVAQDDRPFTVAFNLLNEAMYGSHPYGRPDLGYQETLSKISRDDLMGFYRTYYTPNNMVVAVVGNVSSSEVMAKLNEAFKGFQKRDTPPVPKISLSRPVSIREVSKNKNVRAGIVLFGYLAPPLTDPDSVALRVADNLLGGGMSSRLFVELRDKRGLAYQVGALYSRRLDVSPFVAYIATNPANVSKAKEGFSAEFERLKVEAVSTEELESAKMKVIGQFDLNHERNSDQAFYLAYYELAGVGYSYDRGYTEDISRVTTDDIMRVAKKYFVNPTIAIVAP
jgi:predicted Zn-dependent peptidase